MEVRVDKIMKESGVIPTDVLWEVSTLHYTKGKRRVSSALVRDRADALSLFERASRSVVSGETRCDVIKECTKSDRFTGDLIHKTVVYGIGDGSNETVGITVKMVTVY